MEADTYLSEGQQKIGIIYHYPCYDGCYAALNAYLYYSKAKLSQKYLIEFFPSNSNNRISEVQLSEFKKVYILDKGLNEEDYEYIFKYSNTKTVIIIIDHHNSSIELFNKKFKNAFQNISNVQIIFNASGEKSASGLTFEYFKNEYSKYSNEKADEIFSEQYKIVRFMIIHSLVE
jgi:oligoribonuclease NrnB/cAMP/cGMP phosphodiesterase (DHH superfamily)